MRLGMPKLKTSSANTSKAMCDQMIHADAASNKFRVAASNGAVLVVAWDDVVASGLDSFMTLYKKSYICFLAFFVRCCICVAFDDMIRVEIGQSCLRSLRELRTAPKADCFGRS